MQESYQIRVKGHLGAAWSTWFEGLRINNEPNGEAVLTGSLPDQAALHGVLNRVRDLGLVLIAVQRIEPDPHAERREFRASTEP